MSSKSSPAKFNKDIIKNAQPIVKQSEPLPVSVTARDVTMSLPQVPAQTTENNVITTYKDLNQMARDQFSLQKKQMLFAVALIILASTLLLAYHQITKPRAIASTFTGFATDATPTRTEHYQYDKTCYEGEKGENICLERTSRKR